MTIGILKRLEEILIKSKNAKVTDVFWEKEKESFQKIEENNIKQLKLYGKYKSYKMVIETKFSIKDLVYFMKENKVRSNCIRHINIEVNGTIPKISYTIENERDYILEHLIFKSKEELLESL